MKTKWLLMMLMVVGLMAGAAQANMLVNPSFEDGDYPANHTPDHWEHYWTGYPPQHTWIDNAAEAHSGSKYMMMYNWTAGVSSAYLGQSGVSVVAGNEYEFSVWAKNGPEGQPTEAVMEIEWFDASDVNISDDTATVTDVGDTWAKIDFGTYTAPAGAVSAWVWLVASVNNSAYSILYDDVSMFGFPRPVRFPSPANGDTVSVGDVELSWTNADPNYDGHSVYVDVWFGTEPNVTDPGYDMIKQVTVPVSGENVNTLTVNAPVPNTYYWQVNSYIYGDPAVVNYSNTDPNFPQVIEGPVWSFNTVPDAPPSSVDAGVDMITWTGQPVSLDATVVDDGVSALTYLWTAAPNDGVAITEDGINPDNTATKEAQVTIDKSGLLTTLVLNPGFESPELSDGVNVGTGLVPGWKEGWYDLTNPEVWTGYSYSAGVINPDAAYGYDGTAAEGENMAYAASYVGYDMGLSQILSVALQAETQYDLSVKIGNPSVYNEGATTDYRIELVAGSSEPKTVLASDTGPSPTDDTYWTTASLTHQSGAAGIDPNVGQPLEIRLMTVDDGSVGWEVNFDDVQLTATPAYPFPAVHNVTLTLAVHDEGNPTPVKDTMTIDVYDNACLAAKGKDPTAAKTDLDGNCIANVKDLAEVLATWLVDNSLTAPVVLATTTTSVGSSNAVNASFANGIVDGLVEYWELDGDYSAKMDPTHVGTLTTTGTGSGTFVSGKFGQGIDLENSAGNQAYVLIGGDENDFDFDSGDSMSVSLWYTIESLYTNWQALVAKGEGANWRLHRNSNSSYGSTTVDINWQCGVPGNNPTGYGALDLQDGSWHHVAATVDAVNGGNLYVDGILVDTVAGPADFGGNSAAMQIGGNPGAAGRGWDGILDDVGVWNRALTADEVASIWNGGIGRKIRNLFDPNAPDVDAGNDWIILSGQTVTLTPTVVEQVPTDWTNLTYLWTASPDTGVAITEDGINPDDTATKEAKVKITKATDNPSPVTLTLAVYGQGKPDPVADTLVINVYDDACLAAKAAGSLVYDPGDFDENCITDLKDYAALATEWLIDFNLTAPVAKP